MTQVTIRQLTHGFARYLKAVKRGERIVVLDRKTPVADLIPHHENIAFPGWKRPVRKIKIKGETLSETLVRMRNEDR